VPGRKSRASGGARADGLGEQAYKTLEKKIITTELAPGDWLTETEISAALNISRTPVREALQRLSRAGLVEIIPRRGLRVTPINVSDQIALLAFRRVVECFITTNAARAATPEERMHFRRLASEMQKTSRQADFAEHYRVDLEFKLHLLRCVRNEYAAQAIEPLWAASRRFAWVMRHSRDIPRVARLTAKVMRAVASGDVSATSEATMAFIDCLEDLARSQLVSRSA
jgi:DNA-binding GntR family transcriptional regulator